MRRLHTPAKRTGATDTPYAGGWYIEDFPTYPRHTHGGSGGSFWAYVAIEPENNIAVVLLANAKRESGLHEIGHGVLDWLRGKVS